MSAGRPKLTVATSFPVHPAVGGGQKRVHHLYSELARRVDVEVVTLAAVDVPAWRGSIAPGVTEIRVPKSQEHDREEMKLERVAGTVVTDVALALLHELTPAYSDALGASAQDATFVVACHPYALPAIRSATDAPLWYEAQDVEYQLKAEILPEGELLDTTRRVEARCCAESELILVCTEDDGTRLRELYGVPEERLALAANGVDPGSVRFTSAANRRELKRRLGMQDRFTALFLASWHGPNLSALQTILDLAARMPDVRFMVVGSVAWSVRAHEAPSNVDLVGQVSDGFKDAALRTVDLALNPVTTGSGTNLKMLEYLAAGVPVLSTPLGIRGLDVGSEIVAVAEANDFQAGIETLAAEPLDRLERRARAGRAHVEERFSWRAIADRLLSDPRVRLDIGVAA